MVRAVRDRRRQVGVLRALGFVPNQVRRAFVLESGFVALEGILIGADPRSDHRVAAGRHRRVRRGHRVRRPVGPARRADSIGPRRIAPGNGVAGARGLEDPSGGRAPDRRLGGNSSPQLLSRTCHTPLYRSGHEGRESFACAECGHRSPKWFGRCPECGGWSTARSGVAGAERLRPSPFSTMRCRSRPASPTGIDEVDRVLGGGLVAGSVVLLAGEPGIGKSTLVLQLVAALARHDRGRLLATGEESLDQVARRAPPARDPAGDPGEGVAIDFRRRRDRRVLKRNAPDVLVRRLDPDARGPIAFDQRAGFVDPGARVARLVGSPREAHRYRGHSGRSRDQGRRRRRPEDARARRRCRRLSLDGERTARCRLLRSAKNRFGVDRRDGRIRDVERGPRAGGRSFALVPGGPRAGVPDRSSSRASRARARCLSRSRLSSIRAGYRRPTVVWRSDSRSPPVDARRGASTKRSNLRLPGRGCVRRRRRGRHRSANRRPTSRSASPVLGSARDPDGRTCCRGRRGRSRWRGSRVPALARRLSEAASPWVLDALSFRSVSTEASRPRPRTRRRCRRPRFADARARSCANGAAGRVRRSARVILG